MRQLIRAPTRGTGGEAGFTLIELLVVCALFAVVLGVVMGSLVFAQDDAPKDIAYAQSIADTTSGLQTMLRDIRNAYAIRFTDGDQTSGMGTTIDFFAYQAAQDTSYEVQYNCAQPSTTRSGYYQCVRVEAQATPASPVLLSPTRGAVIIDRIQSPEVFTFLNSSGSPDPLYATYVKASLRVPSDGKLYHGLTHLIALDNGTALPNLANGS
jgi:prepilin-type N-terminal cleavage/methylation domain-containing protein